MMEESSISPIRSDFEQIKKQHKSGSEYWTSRDLYVALCYSTYQKFTRTISTAIAIANHKGLNTAEHFNHTVEMVRLVFGSFRNMESIHLTCMADLFGVNVRTINYHLGQIYESGEHTKRGNYPKNWDSSIERGTRQT